MNTTPAAASAIVTDELTKSYGGAGERPALAPLTLDIPVGQLVALVGHNGSGKTTFMRMVAGLLEPSGGTVHVCGAPRQSIEARAALAYLADHPTFYDDLSLREHLEYVSRMHGVVDWAPEAERLVDHLGLGDRIDLLPTTFSRGLRQKAAIALAFVRPFELLLVDEPFVGLDQAGKQALLALFDEAHTRGATLVVATHELGFVHRADRLLALGDGEVRYDGAPGDTDVQALVFHT
ncbi:MAG: ABC transporter ATP-binding protein [Ilumatobacteraceae bacterium]|nr:ABC transporter ATP-binding protein [Acidimicrobiales bacterium]MCB9392868.1 ABC transporter ATP-binding protein [Acidimicrobiaceae bacterium]